MGKYFSARLVAIVVLALAGSALIAGCGDDDGSKTALGESSPGATAGATGNAAGGAAPEAGKIRDPQDVENEKKNFSDEPPPIQISSGNESELKLDDPKAYIVQSNKELKKMRTDAFNNSKESQSWAATDFKTRQFVGVFMPKSEKGSLIAITDIYQDGDDIVIKVTKLLNGEGCKTGNTRPAPWQVVETRKMTGTPALKVTDQESSPC